MSRPPNITSSDEDQVLWATDDSYYAGRPSASACDGSYRSFVYSRGFKFRDAVEEVFALVVAFCHLVVIHSGQHASGGSSHAVQLIENVHDYALFWVSKNARSWS
jgi:hypothetical protein